MMNLLNTFIHFSEQLYFLKEKFRIKIIVQFLDISNEIVNTLFFGIGNEY